MADVIVERDSDTERRSSGPLTAIIVIAVLIIAALFLLPRLVNTSNSDAGNNTSTGTSANTTTPAPTTNTTTPSTNTTP